MIITGHWPRMIIGLPIIMLIMLEMKIHSLRVELILEMAVIYNSAIANRTHHSLYLHQLFKEKNFLAIFLNFLRCFRIIANIITIDEQIFHLIIKILKGREMN